MHTTNVSFTKTTDKDWALLLRLEKSEIGNRIYTPETNMKKFKDFFSKSVMYLIKANGTLAGFCGYERRKNEGEITGLLVLKQFRNRGLGGLAIEKCLRELNTGKTKISTSPENTVALKLYEKHGFVIKERSDNYWQGQPRLILYRVN